MNEYRGILTVGHTPMYKNTIMYTSVKIKKNVPAPITQTLVVADIVFLLNAV